MSTQTETTELESKSLPTHVEKCAMRYEGLQARFEVVEQRLNTIESNINRIHYDVIKGNASLTKVLITTAGTVIAGIISAVAVIIIG